MAKAETLVSEGSREWEMLKYACHFTTAGEAKATGSDAILNALAQLAAHRLQAGRATISFFDRKHQHIVAEATPSSPICPILAQRNGHSGIVERADSLCNHVLQLHKTEPCGGLAVSVVSDLTEDADLLNASCAQGFPDGRFYCGTPIRSPRGFNIGVLGVYDDTPRPEGLDQDSIRFLRDLSKTIMSYLETIRTTKNFSRSERMVNGLGHLIRGTDDATDDHTSPWWRDGRARNPRDASSETVSTNQVTDLSIDPQAKSEDLNLGANEPPRSCASPSTATNGPAEPPTFVHHQKTQFAKVLSKAAKVVCGALRVEGTIFLDAGITSPRGSHDVDHKSQNDSTSSSEDSSTDHPHGYQDKMPCTILALSTTDQTVSDLAQPRMQVSLTQKTLKRLLGRYPNGKIFNLEESGALYSGESSSGEEADTQGQGPPKVVPDAKPTLWHKDEFKPIAELFAGARSVALVPLWDPSRDRFYACGFVWSKTTARILTQEADLAYLKALGIVTMAEINRIDIALANKAKADLLDTVSHELRSPLHGILASAELLADSLLDPLQQEVVRALGISGRTLLYTIDHLLVYSKVNNISRALKKGNRKHHGFYRVEEEGRMRIDPDKAVWMQDVALDQLAEEVIETVFIGHTFHHKSTPEGPKWAPPDTSLVGKVQVSVDIDHRKPWAFRTIPGAICRIIMNIFGNALKYTPQGHVNIKLEQKEGKASRRSAMVVLTVSDTGKGISDEFLHNKLFVPFSQEDSLNVGTGLGLSIVKRIATSLGGSVSVRSHIGKGTTVSVSLPLVYGDVNETRSTEDPFSFDGKVPDGLRVSAVGFSRARSAPGEVSSSADLPLESLPLKWFNMTLCEADDTDSSPDVIIYSEAAFGKLCKNTLTNHAVPAVVICHNPDTALRLDTLFPKTGTTFCFEFIHQPCTPRKFGTILASALNRRKQLQEAVGPSTPENDEANGPSPLVSDVNGEWPCVQTDQNVTNQVSNGDSQKPSFDLTVQSLTILDDGDGRSENSNGSKAEEPVVEESFEPQFLLVDDNSINLRATINGLEALKTFQSDPKRFCCVFMDINMPIMDGLESTRQIREFERENHLTPITIIAITGLATDSARNEAFASGMDVFLTRPVGLRQLIPVLEEKVFGSIEAGQGPDS
ncbi:hypothetical protein FDECE_3414 [Fusarium decemcellulare]|nr:hypothetical protein FDECE_3414 [Fusarium decemcellulare]